MRRDITRFIEKVKGKYGLEAIYLPIKDLYCLRYKGRGVQNFNSKNFYTLPQRHRERLIHAIIKVGLNHNVGEKHRDSIYQQRNIGKTI